jgi:hypothetical protein
MRLRADICKMSWFSTVETLPGFWVGRCILTSLRPPHSLISSSWGLEIARALDHLLLWGCIALSRCMGLLLILLLLNGSKNRSDRQSSNVLLGMAVLLVLALVLTLALHRAFVIL